MKEKSVTSITFSPDEAADIIKYHVRREHPKCKGKPDCKVSVRFKIESRDMPGDYHAQYPLDHLLGSVEVEIEE